MSLATNGRSTETTLSKPLFQVGGDGEQESRVTRWWEIRMLELEEAKRQCLTSFPMMLTNVFFYLIPLVSVMFAGHLGQLEFAGAALANSWATVTGYALMFGLSGALETLYGQGFGAKQYRMLGIYLQASSIISFLISIIISFLWFYTEPILMLLHQDPQISKTAALYTRYLIPGIFAYGFLENMLRFLQTQSVVASLIFLSMLPMVLHIGIAYSLVNWTALGFKGAPLAVSISLWISIMVLAMSVGFSKEFKHTWTGFSLESFRYIFTVLRLALPSAAMVGLEYWALEILVFLAGSMSNSEQTTSLIAMCVNTETIAYMFTYGLSAAASTRVSNELGAGNPEQAKNAMAVSLKLSVLLAILVVLFLGFGHDIWAGFFSDSSAIIKKFAAMTPLLALSIIADSVQGVLSGVARGCGWQHIAAIGNLVTYYVVGMPIAILLSFNFNLNAMGLWIGLICGLSCQASTLLFITLRTEWTRLELIPQ